MVDPKEPLFPLPKYAPVDVEFYHDMLKNFATNHKSPNEVLQKYRVTRVTHYKERGSVQHELLLATVLDDDGSPILFRLDRNATNNKNLMHSFADRIKLLNDDDERKVFDALNKDIETAKSQKQTASFLGYKGADNWKHKFIFPIPLSIRNSSPSVAQDIVTRMRPNFKLDRSWVKVDSVQPRSLYMYHLAIIAMIVHKRDPYYTVLHHQCYWFSAMIVAVIRQLQQDADERYPPVFDDSLDTTLNSGYQGASN